MSRILILGASRLQVPAIEKAHELGLKVGVVDRDATAPGVRLADSFFEVSTTDEQSICDIAEKFMADAVFTLGTDMPVRAAALACQKLSLPGISYATALKATDKVQMIETFKKEGIAHPNFAVLYSAEEALGKITELGYPCILKPADSSGSRGVVVVEQRSQVVEAFRYSAKFSRSSTVIAEELLTGAEVSVELFIDNGNVNVLQITDKITTGAPHFVELGHVQPSSLSTKTKKQISTTAIAAVKALGIDNGVAHAEVILTTEGPKMIEIGARLGGDYITTHLVPLSTGVDMVGAAIMQSLGRNLDITVERNYGSAVKYLQVPSGLLERISGIEDAMLVPGVVDLQLFRSPGDQIRTVKSSGDRMGCVIASGVTAEDAVMSCRAAESRLSIVVKNDGINCT